MNISAELIGASIQIIGFSAIPFLYWLLTDSKKTSFFYWTGLKTPVIKKKKRFVVIFLGELLIFTSISLIVLSSIRNHTQLAFIQFSGQGMKVIIPVLIFSFLKTGLSEEILFRGFFGKRFIAKFGFTIGNTIQATLFGALHGVMLFESVGIFKVLLVVIFTGFVGWAMGYINEKEANGSIVPSWLLHGIANVIPSILAVFNVL